MTPTRIIVDGMDGAGKSTLVQGLLNRGYDAQDRGHATHMVDDDALQAEQGVLYIILLADPRLCRQRLRDAGKDLDERYHTLDSLTHYRQRYPQIMHRLPLAVTLVSAGSRQQTLDQACAAAREHGLVAVAAAGDR